MRCGSRAYALRFGLRWAVWKVFFVVLEVRVETYCFQRETKSAVVRLGVDEERVADDVINFRIFCNNNRFSLNSME